MRGLRLFLCKLQNNQNTIVVFQSSYKYGLGGKYEGGKMLMKGMYGIKRKGWKKMVIKGNGSYLRKENMIK